MTDSARIAALVVYRMQQADEAVSAADLDLTGGFERAAVNRAYYAMFYAVLALLVVRKLGTSKHSAAISYFDLLYMKPALLPRELSAWLREAFAQRSEADYAEESRSLAARSRRSSDAPVSSCRRSGIIWPHRRRPTRILTTRRCGGGADAAVARATTR